MREQHADQIEMQNRLFAELSAMFGREVPLYDKSLAVNFRCNRVVCDLLAQMHRGFRVSDAQLDKTSSERHGAIRIGRPDEYRWIARFFACFAMKPHNFYDMTSVGAKSQPVIATAFRSVVHPEHRVFTSLLQTDYFDDATRARIESILAERRVFSDTAKALIERCESQGGLSAEDGDALIREGTERIFKWTGAARDFGLYTDLCDAGFKIAADIACFEAHHLNHLTPNTFCMDLYTAAMKFRMGAMDEAAFRACARLAIGHLEAQGGAHFLRLHFKHLSRADIEALEPTPLAAGAIDRAVDSLVASLDIPELDLAALDHNGFKDSTEGPSWDTPVLLRQDAYKALSEPVRFAEPDGTATDADHTARFGEIEQRFYATTPKGRDLYDRCLADATQGDPSAYASHFAPFPKTLEELLEQGLVYGRFEATASGRAAMGTHTSADLFALAKAGHVAFEGLRYEDFLPVSAAGIFASNLNQYGTQATAATKPTYTRAMLEQIMGMEIVDADAVYRGLHAESVLQTLADLGVLDRLSDAERGELESAVSALPAGVAKGFSDRAVEAARV